MTDRNPWYRLLPVPAVLATLLIAVGAHSDSAQRTIVQPGAGAAPFQPATLALETPTVTSMLRDLASGNVIGGPLLVEATGPITGRFLFSYGAVTDVALTIVNLGDETIDFTSSPGTLLLSVLPGQSRAIVLSAAAAASNLKWNCVGSGEARFLWVGRGI